MPICSLSVATISVWRKKFYIFSIVKNSGSVRCLCDYSFIRKDFLSNVDLEIIICFCQKQKLNMSFLESARGLNTGPHTSKVCAPSQGYSHSLRAEYLDMLHYTIIWSFFNQRYRFIKIFWVKGLDWNCSS